MEFCPHGDLNDLLEYHTLIDRPIPEPSIWYIFESLVNVGLLMEQGSITQAQARWLQIIHRDPKPHNVFLGPHPQAVPNRDNWAAYPTIKLGDYGLSVFTSPSDNRNLRDFMGAGTSAYQAPEQISVQGGPPRPRLTTKTNVFGVGITIVSLMSRNRDVGVEDHWGAALSGSKNDDDFPHLTGEAADNYSDDLVRLVSTCVKCNQDKRPSFGELQKTISYFTQGARGMPHGQRGLSGHDRADGMRMTDDPQLQQLGLVPDRWAVGQSLPADPESDLDEDEDEDEEGIRGGRGGRGGGGRGRGGRGRGGGCQ